MMWEDVEQFMAIFGFSETILTDVFFRLGWHTVQRWNNGQRSHAGVHIFDKMAA